ncbi:Ala-tRNA(Pro) hydrolase [Litorimonas taeanensis]|uniref:Ala-tRNA(Pro) hydrolase n=1 Tax=Litorimonas taeanensis TaxID=568099 RepID=A0A420WEF1_9PROT|nr:prolyl-tRNA synthetase associated domain-containing protein [Litorimonas taeanensis]RKQ69414.1 Ala-tRNA(Pro) hydrolase [Litorimonas taeanensis]
MTSSREQALFSQLESLNIVTETHNHAAIFTVAEGEGQRKSRAGRHTKNLFLKDKAGAYVLICAVNDTQIRLNRLHKPLGTKRLSFGKPEALIEKLGVKPGSVTLFSIINDMGSEVRLVLDKALFSYERVWFHPLRNTASTAIYTKDILKFAKALNHEPTVIDFKALNEDSPLG